jgi:hypothetical protein
MVWTVLELPISKQVLEIGNKNCGNPPQKKKKKMIYMAGSVASLGRVIVPSQSAYFHLWSECSRKKCHRGYNTLL